MDTIIDRKDESEALQNIFSLNSSLSLVYGQRRTGKTFLLQHILGNQKNALFFIADESTSQILLKRFIEESLNRGSGIASLNYDEKSLGSWAAALTILIQNAALSQKPMYIVLDEFQYLLNAEPSMPSVLQRIWDQFKDRMKLHIVLCGSALGVLSGLGDSGEPLYGRFNLRMKLKPFNYFQASLFTPEWNVKNRFLSYGIYGGLARHLAEIDPFLELSKNAIQSILNPLGTLHDAAMDMIRCERVTSRAEASAVISTVAFGETSFNSIASKTGLTSARLDYIFKELISLEIIRRETRFGDKPGSRYSRYLAADPLTSFSSRFVVSNQTALLGAPADVIWRERVEPRLNDYMGFVFEEIVRQAVIDGILSDFTGPVDEASSYWSRDGSTQIDLAARSGDNTCLFECKWSPETIVDVSALKQLRDHASRFPLKSDMKVKLCLASAGEFSEDLHKLESLGEVVLIGPGELFRNK